MAKVKFFGVLRLATGCNETLNINAANVMELLSLLSPIVKNTSFEELMDAIIFVDGKDIFTGKKYKTKLTENSEVTLMLPVGGG